MSIAFDIEAARRRYADAEMDELVKVAFVRSEDYVETAVALARAELERRGLSGSDHPVATAAAEAVASRGKAEEQASRQPANRIWLVICFLFADLVAVLSALLYSAKGRHVAANQVWKAFGLGWLFRFALIAFYTYPWGK